MKLTAEVLNKLMDTYFEVCDETGLQKTGKGYKFFMEVMFDDYMKHCERNQLELSWKAFKRNSISIAEEMIQKACNM